MNISNQTFDYNAYYLIFFFVLNFLSQLSFPIILAPSDEETKELFYDISKLQRIEVEIVVWRCKCP